jgi:hypothetical protein
MENEYTTYKEAVITICKGDKLQAIIYSDPITRKQVFYTCKEMHGDDIANMISGNVMPLNGRSVVRKSKNHELVPTIE